MGGSGTGPPAVMMTRIGSHPPSLVPSREEESGEVLHTTLSGSHDRPQPLPRNFHALDSRDNCNNNDSIKDMHMDGTTDSGPKLIRGSENQGKSSLDAPSSTNKSQSLGKPISNKEGMMTLLHQGEKDDNFLAATLATLSESLSEEYAKLEAISSDEPSILSDESSLTMEESIMNIQQRYNSSNKLGSTLARGTTRNEGINRLYPSTEGESTASSAKLSISGFQNELRKLEERKRQRSAQFYNDMQTREKMIEEQRAQVAKWENRFSSPATQIGDGDGAHSGGGGSGGVHQEHAVTTTTTTKASKSPPSSMNSDYARLLALRKKVRERESVFRGQIQRSLSAETGSDPPPPPPSQSRQIQRSDNTQHASALSPTPQNEEQTELARQLQDTRARLLEAERCIVEQEEHSESILDELSEELERSKAAVAVLRGSLEATKEALSDSYLKNMAIEHELIGCKESLQMTEDFLVEKDQVRELHIEGLQMQLAGSRQNEQMLRASLVQSETQVAELRAKLEQITSMDVSNHSSSTIRQLVDTFRTGQAMVTSEKNDHSSRPNEELLLSMLHESQENESRLQEMLTKSNRRVVELTERLGKAIQEEKRLSDQVSDCADGQYPTQDKGKDLYLQALFCISESKKRQDPSVHQPKLGRYRRRSAAIPSEKQQAHPRLGNWLDQFWRCADDFAEVVAKDVRCRDAMKNVGMVCTQPKSSARDVVRAIFVYFFCIIGLVLGGMLQACLGIANKATSSVRELWMHERPADKWVGKLLRESVSEVVENEFWYWEIFKLLVNGCTYALATLFRLFIASCPFLVLGLGELVDMVKK